MTIEKAGHALASELFDPRGAGGWTPRRLKAGPSVTIRLPNDGPTIEHRLAAGVAWYASGRYSGQAANDNQDWPLAKALRQGNMLDKLEMAERYRALYEAATAMVELTRVFRYRLQSKRISTTPRFVWWGSKGSHPQPNRHDGVSGG